MRKKCGGGKRKKQGGDELVGTNYNEASKHYNSNKV